MKTETIILLVLAGGALWWWSQRDPKAGKGAGAGAADSSPPETVPEDGNVAISDTFEPQFAEPPPLRRIGARRLPGPYGAGALGSLGSVPPGHAERFYPDGRAGI